MQRVAVVGSGGAGKSTFSEALGRLTGLPVVHLDRHYWQPGWAALPREEWRDEQARLLAGGRWIADGNYSSTLDLRLERADTVIVLALPRWLCMVRVLGRWWHNGGRAVQAEGCPERLDPAFLRWVWSYPVEGRARLDAELGRHAGRLRVVELATPKEVRLFLAAVDPKAAAGPPPADIP
ncbi:MAG: adenylate kinase [Actinomycetota bacterium]|nr:adenylate kinase [Actinomycetota bacterium]